MTNLSESIIISSVLGRVFSQYPSLFVLVSIQENISIFIRETLKPVEGIDKRCVVSLYIEARITEL